MQDAAPITSINVEVRTDDDWGSFLDRLNDELGQAVDDLEAYLEREDN